MRVNDYWGAWMLLAHAIWASYCHYQPDGVGRALVRGAVAVCVLNAFMVHKENPSTQEASDDS